jgi:hypothetical protein
MFERTIAQMRLRVERYLTDRCDIRRFNVVTSGAGHTAEIPSVVQGDVKCRVLPMKRQATDFTGEQEMGKNFFRLAVPYDTDLRDGDQVEIGGVVYEVMELNDARTDATDLQATIARVR